MNNRSRRASENPRAVVLGARAVILHFFSTTLGNCINLSLYIYIYIHIYIYIYIYSKSVRIFV